MSNENKFTPGPWRVVKARRAAENVLTHSVVDSDWEPVASDMTIPDATLIAAAPDLLEAAKKAEKAFLTGQPRIVGDDTEYPLDGALVGNALNALRAAITKATT